MAIKKFILSIIIVIGINKIIGKYTRIVNGVSVRSGEIPYQVSIQEVSSGHFCGGVVLNKYFVITASHCAIYKPQETIKIIAGTINFNEINEIHDVIHIYIHEQFQSLDQYKFVNDIALMKIDPLIKFDHTTNPITLPTQNLMIPHNKKAVASGWGRLVGPNSMYPKKLKKVEVQILDQQVCINMYGIVNRLIHPKQICTFRDDHKRRGACNVCRLNLRKGDSGGPLVIDKNILIGISSWSRKDPNCASPEFPDVYTRVSEYVHWINSKII